MTSERFISGVAEALRLGAMALGFALAFAIGPALAGRLVPENFFDRIPETNSGQAGFAADYLFHNSETGLITAYGDVGLSYIGYYANADRMVFNQKTRELVLEGNVRIVDPAGVVYTADRVTVTDGFKDAVLNAMVMTTPDGIMVTGAEVRKIRGKVTEIDKGTYSPCGTCVDEKGRRIGWRVRTEKMVQNTEEEYTELSNAMLEVLGYPIAWLPWIRVPDLTDENGSGFRLPSVAYSEKIGVKVSVPYYLALKDGMSLLFTPSLISRQGLLLGAQFFHPIPGGSYSVTAHGIYQLDPDAFTTGFGDTRLRGAIQTSGEFTPAERWKMGWSYSAFTDPAFLSDYLIESSSLTVNEAYAEYLSPDTFGEARIQEFVQLGAVTRATQNQQAALLPKLRVDHVQELEQDGGTVHLSGDLIGVARDNDKVASNAIAYRLGTREFKTHTMAEADWSKQYILGPAAVTPLAGLRLDYATYNGASALQPGATSLLSATPIAALDVRVPFVAYDEGSSYLIEPVAQAYYRGGVAEPGITNDNAQSFTFDEANLFSYNKFSGTDRQETGLRANLGVHYLANFADGSYLDTVLGQSFHIAGPNSLATADAANAGAGAGLSGTSSDVVAGVRAGMGPVTLSARARYDLAAAQIAAFSTNASYAYQGWRLGADYSYMAPDAARGYTGVQQDAGVSVSIPFYDYYRLTAGLGWDITAGQMVDYSAALVYDDGYFEAGAEITSSGPLIYDPSTFAYTFKFRLKAPDGTCIGI